MPPFHQGGDCVRHAVPPRGAGLHRLMVRTARPGRARPAGILLWILPPETRALAAVSRPATIVERWNGTAWRRVPTAGLPLTSTDAVAARARGGTWTRTVVPATTGTTVQQ